MKTPTSIPEFNKEWLKFILEDWLNKKSDSSNSVEILEFKASKNSLQVFNPNNIIDSMTQELICRVN